MVGGLSNELFNKLFVVIIGALIGICSFGLNRTISELDEKSEALSRRVDVLANEGEERTERIIRIEESFKWISAELGRLNAEVGKSNQKLDQLIDRNR